MNTRTLCALAMNFGLGATLAISAATAQTAPAAPAADIGGAAPSAAAPSAAAAVLPSTCAGPLVEERRALLDHIQQAGAHGIGIANYMSAYKALDDQVASGASEPQVRSRVESITKALKEQLMRAQVLKVQRPLPPTASQQAEAGAATGGSPVAGGGGGGDPIKNALAKSGKNPDDIINKLKEKFGAGGMDIPDGLKDKLLNSDKGKELLKKFGGM